LSRLSGLANATAGQTEIMLTVLLVLIAVALVATAGEAVRGQCRRMLMRPAPTADTTQPMTGELAA
jgi:hypothetical protein